MTEKVERTEMTTIKENITDNHNTNGNPILSVISKFQSLFKPPPPPPKQQPKEQPQEEAKPIVVKMPRGEMEIPSLRLEGDEQCSDHNTNPLVLWQVYAIGGFFVLRWVLARLNERRTKKKPSDEEPSPGDD